MRSFPTDAFELHIKYRIFQRRQALGISEALRTATKRTLAIFNRLYLMQAWGQGFLTGVEWEAGDDDTLMNQTYTPSPSTIS